MLTYEWTFCITLLPLHAQRTKRLSEPEVREARAKQCLLNLTGYCFHQLMVAGVPAQTRASQHSFVEQGGVPSWSWEEFHHGSGRSSIIEQGGDPLWSGEEFHHRAGAVCLLSVVLGSRLTMLRGMAHVHVDMGSTERTRWVIKTKDTNMTENGWWP